MGSVVHDIMHTHTHTQTQIKLVGSLTVVSKGVDGVLPLWITSVNSLCPT